MNNNRNMGAIFCQVRNTNETKLDSLVISSAPQKCKGASLVFNRIPSVSHFPRKPHQPENTPPLRIIKDPTLCTMK